MLDKGFLDTLIYLRVFPVLVIIVFIRLLGIARRITDNH